MRVTPAPAWSAACAILSEPRLNGGPRARSIVSLHGHTLHSKENLGFIRRLAERVGPVRWALERGAERYRAAYGAVFEVDRAWWTPPLAPHDAWLLETRHIENRFDARALVSLTDHDDIEAPVTLGVLAECRSLPISVEWTVPFGPTFFHLGVHDLPPDRARSIMSDLSEYTAQPRQSRLGELLASLAEEPRTLVVFNHPCWDESGIGKDRHIETVRTFVREIGAHVHALELNGLRPWTENREVIGLARELGTPLISGGDRHALEPNTILNLTDATTFSEFVAEVRAGHSRILVTNQYRECFALRILHNLEQVLADYESHGLGWRKWSDRVFFRCDDGVARSLTELFPRRMPASLSLFVGGVHLLRQPAVQGAFRAMFGGRQEIAP